MEQDQLILDIKIANYRKLKQQKIDEENNFQQTQPLIKEKKKKIFNDDMHLFSKAFFTGLPFGLGAMIAFRSLLIFPFAIGLTSFIQEKLRQEISILN